jgi:hypothetical protein
MSTARTRSTEGLALIAAILLAGLPAGVAAQACFGGPSNEGEFVIGVGATSHDGNHGGELVANVNLEGVVDFASTLGFVDMSPGATGVVGTGTALFGLPTRRAEVCVAAGFTHTTWERPEEGRLSLLTLPAGISLGRSLEVSEGVDLVPWVDGGALLTWSSASSGSASGGSSEWGAFLRCGVGLQLGPIHVRLAGLASTTEARESELSMQLGWTVRPTLTAAEDDR